MPRRSKNWPCTSPTTLRWPPAGTSTRSRVPSPAKTVVASSTKTCASSHRHRAPLARYSPSATANSGEASSRPRYRGASSDRTSVSTSGAPPGAAARRSTAAAPLPLQLRGAAGRRRLGPTRAAAPLSSSAARSRSLLVEPSCPAWCRVIVIGRRGAARTADCGRHRVPSSRFQCPPPAWVAKAADGGAGARAAMAHPYQRGRTGHLSE
mmetsp:Transcript_104095/g.330972  ORF Transcript_104095/g.330972 Transcript_104095/m.330972 type:complete len:209 (+) Transcript_104095:881-1507(+)